MKNRNLDHKDDWATCPNYLKTVTARIGKYFDPCPWHHDLSLWDGLDIEWQDVNFINPPYSEPLKSQFVKKAIHESKKDKLCFMLLPVSTSTRLYHNLIDPNMKTQKFVFKRIPFIGINDKGQKVNYHLIQETTKETISFTGIDKKTGEVISKEIPLYIRASGQHDSMEIIFKP
jgi:hypothetical protein